MEQLEAASGMEAHRPKCRYDLPFIKEIIGEIEKGSSVVSVRSKYQIPRGTLDAWLRRFSSPNFRPVVRNNISAAEKRTIVRAVFGGKLSIKEARLAYQVGESSIHKWKQQYLKENAELGFSNHEELNKKKIKKQTDPQSDQVRQLQQQLADAQLKIAALNTLIDVAEEQFKINIRKKPGARQS